MHFEFRYWVPPQRNACADDLKEREATVSVGGEVLEGSRRTICKPDFANPGRREPVRITGYFVSESSSHSIRSLAGTATTHWNSEG